MKYQKIVLPKEGEAIAVHPDGTLDVPAQPIMPFIEGDGIGIDVTPVMRRVVDEALHLAYEDEKRLVWMEVYAGEKAVKLYGEGQLLPEETMDALQRYAVSIKGPLGTPVGSGHRSLNVTIRQRMDLYACVRPIRYFPGTPTPLKDSEHTKMTIFRENTEDIYAGIEWPAGSREVIKLIHYLQEEMGVKSLRFPNSSGIGIKPVSREGSKRLVRKAIRYALDGDHSSVTLVHKGNIMKYTEGAFRDWGYEVAREEFGATVVDDGPTCEINHPGTGAKVIVKDVIADNFLQQILLNPQDYDIIATLNLNGDYISDALAAQVGGIGIAPGANMSDQVAVFEATHGTAPGLAGKNQVNPGSLILSAEMMLRHLGWCEAADLILKGVASAIAARTVTYDLARVRGALTAPPRQTVEDQEGKKVTVHEDVQRLMPGATLVSCSGFGEEVIKHMRQARAKPSIAAVS